MQFSSVNSRVSSFKNCRYFSDSKKINMLALAGFFSISPNSTTTKCYNCHIEIHNWKPTDGNIDIVTRHITENPVCTQAIMDAKQMGIKIEKNKENYQEDLKKFSDTIKIMDLSILMNRLKTFKYWSWDHIVSRISLVEAGFIYIGFVEKNDRVQCVYCELILKDWKVGDIAKDEHIRFGRNRGCQLVAFDFDEKKTLKCQKPSFGKIKQLKAGEVLSSKDDEYLHKFSTEELGINIDKPKIPDMASEQKRLSSFMKNNWPFETTKQKPEDLAKTGFFYLGKGFDSTQCFWCGLGLMQWNPEDNPLNEHLRHNSECYFLKQILENNSTNFNFEKKFEVEESLIEKKMETFNLNHKADPTDEYICKICFDKLRTIVYLPCKHFVACEFCAFVVKNCPVCRSVIKGTIKIYV